MKRILTIAISALTLTAQAQATTGWHVAASKSVSGAFAITAASATISRPGQIAVRLIGHVTSGSAIVACSKGVSVASYSRTYTKAGLYLLPLNPARADSCQITASVGGSGRVTVQVVNR